MNDSKGDTWYQAVLQLDEKERVAAPKYLPIGPPRRLVADILLDLTRNVETAKKQKISSFYDSHEGGAITLWPNHLPFPIYTSQTELKLLEKKV